MCNYITNFCKIKNSQTFPLNAYTILLLMFDISTRNIANISSAAVHKTHNIAM